jgi:hypothetical protein
MIAFARKGSFILYYDFLAELTALKGANFKKVTSLDNNVPNCYIEFSKSYEWKQYSNK